MARTQITFEPDGSETYRLKFLGIEFIKNNAEESIYTMRLDEQIKTELEETLRDILGIFDYNEILGYAANIEDEGEFSEIWEANNAFSWYEGIVLKEARKL